MRTVNEVVRDVLANPEAYTDAFPVSTSEVQSSYSRELRGMQWPPMTVDFMRRMLEERSLLLRGTWSDGETRFVQDESHPRDRATMVNMPLREDSWAARMLNRERQDWLARPAVWEQADRRWMENMVALTAIDDPSMGTAQDYAGDGEEVLDMARLANMQDSLNRSEEVIRRHLEQSATPPRPDHYRVSPGRCHCGFTSMFTGDMIDHVAGRVILANNHQWTWRLCECGASALCHQVAEPAYLGLDFATHQPTMRTIPIYLCDACCQRRGIR